ncbi:MAG: hypothetical protein KIG32_07395 [Ruminiclostridium sp.]|nr:hypothetical protein [Ruminiclostridium sp.]
MTSEVFVALCSLIGTALGTFGGTKLMSYRIEQLERKVEKHNSVVERMAVMENKMTVADHRISDLEGEVKSIERSADKID